MTPLPTPFVQPASGAIRAPLAHWLRLLWDKAPPLHLDSEAPFIAAGAIHLPACLHWQQHRAAAAHAAAHLVYSRSRFDGRGLGPIARSLLALLEDARIEALATRELPGLARLWRPLHTATPADGAGCEALMQRLARTLADPAYDDPHPWVRKGHQLFYLDGGLGLLALRTPAELRTAAMRLGHDIGQMRLPFNAKTYRPAPHYRDDHRWMWAADDLARAEPPPAPISAGGAEPPEETAADATETFAHHPEWDRLIARLRPAWCRVIERHVPLSEAAPGAPRAHEDPAAEALSHRLRLPLRAMNRHPAERALARDGEHFDLDSLLRACIDQRARQPPDARVYRGRQRRAPRAAVWLLVDRSASTAASHGPGGGGSSGSVLQAAARSAAALAQALHAMGVACTVAGFSSNGRHAVRLQVLKRSHEAAGSALAGQLHALRPEGSTRIGAALRHAAAALAAHRAGPRWVLLLSDGQPHDVDVHDPRYLIEDARHAVRAAARAGVRVACFTLAPDARGDMAAGARRIFGRRGMQGLDTLDDLPRAMQRLLA